MSTYGNNSGNGNGHANGNGVWKTIGAESFGLGVAELVSMGVSLGVVATADLFAPSLLKGTSKVIGKIIEPYLTTIENGLQKVCKLEECQPDLTQSRQERAENLAKTLTVFSAAWAISMAAKIGTRVGMNSMMKLNGNGTAKTGSWFKDNLMPKKHDLKIIAWDEGVHIGSLLWFNTAAAKHTDSMIHATSSMLQSWGVSEKKSKEIASMGVIWELPNLLGWLAGVGAIAHDRLSSQANHVDRLQSQTSLSSHTYSPVHGFT